MKDIQYRLELGVIRQEIEKKDSKPHYYKDKSGRIRKIIFRGWGKTHAVEEMPSISAY